MFFRMISRIFLKKPFYLGYNSAGQKNLLCIFYSLGAMGPKKGQGKRAWFTNFNEDPTS
jgi:hypothetical protein